MQVFHAVNDGNDALNFFRTAHRVKIQQIYFSDFTIIASSKIFFYLRVLGGFLGSRFSSLLGFPDPLLLLVQSLLRLLPVLLTLVLCKLLRVGLHLLQPLIRLLVEVDLASSGQVSRGLQNEVLTNVFRGGVGE